MKPTAHNIARTVAARAKGEHLKAANDQPAAVPPDATRCRLYEPSFKYVPASRTSLAATFARIRREQAKQSTPANVTALKARKAVK